MLLFTSGGCYYKDRLAYIVERLVNQFHYDAGHFAKKRFIRILLILADQTAGQTSTIAPIQVQRLALLLILGNTFRCISEQSEELSLLTRETGPSAALISLDS